MAKKNFDKEEKLSFEAKLIDKISNFFVKNRLATLVVILLVIVGIIGAIIGVNVANSSKDKAQIEIAKLEEEYTSLLSAENPEWEAFITKLNAKVSGSSYPSVKAQYLIGLSYYYQEDYENALNAFEKAYSLNSNIYLAPLALCNAASSADALDNTTKALELYNKVASDFSESGVAPRALFNVGRIYYQQGNTQLAKATFEQVSDYYANSEYGKLALNIANVL